MRKVYQIQAYDATGGLIAFAKVYTKKAAEKTASKFLNRYNQVRVCIGPAETIQVSVIMNPNKWEEQPK